MHLLSTMLLVWLGISAASLAAAALLVAVEICAMATESPLDAGAPACRPAADPTSRRRGPAFVPAVPA